MEALIDAGVHMGLPRRLSEQLVVETLRGSVEYYCKAEHHPAALRNQVTSPGGTSAEALYYLEKAGFRTAISRSVWAAYQRSLELGKERPIHIEGLANGDWIVLDFSDIIVHLFQPGLREKYSLEKLFSESQVIDLDIKISAEQDLFSNC